MSKNITLNAYDDISPNNNVFQKSFINGGLEVNDNDGIFLDKAIIPNSGNINIGRDLKNDYWAYAYPSIPVTIDTGLLGGTSTGTISGSFTIDVSGVSTAYYHVGYRLMIQGFATSTPIIITQIVGNPDASTKLFYLNQPVTCSAGTNVYGFFCGNQLLVKNTTAGTTYPPLGGVLDLPNFETFGAYKTFGTNPTNNQLVIYITNCSEYNYVTGYNNFYILSLNFSFTDTISASIFNNTIFSIIQEVQVPRGSYTLSSLNSFFQKTFSDNGHLVYNKSTNKIFTPVTYTSYPTYTSNRSILGYTYATSLSTQFGTNATYNQTYYDNLDFAYPQLLTTEFPLNNYQKNTLMGWDSIAGSPNVTSYLGIGRTFYQELDPLPNNPQYITFNVPPQNPQLGYGYAFQTRLMEAGTYTVFVRAAKRVSGAATIFRVSTVSATGGTLYYDVTIAAGMWNSYAIDIPIVATEMVEIGFWFIPRSTEINGNSGSIANINIVNKNTLLYPYGLGNKWKLFYGGAGSKIWNNYSMQKYQLYTINANAGTYVQNGRDYYTTISYHPVPLNPNTVSGSGNFSIYQIGYYLTGAYQNNLGYNVASSNNAELTSPYSVMPYGYNFQVMNGFIIKCTLVRNVSNGATDTVISFPLTSPFGSNNIYIGDKRDTVPIQKGRYNNITVTICDQFGTPIRLLDPNVLLNFIIGNRKILGI